MSGGANLPTELLDIVITRLVEQLAPQVADELERRHLVPGSVKGLATLISLDELVAELPKAKRPETWKRWLYERLRRGQVPGAVKLAGAWWFRPDEVRAWLERGES